MMQRSVGFRCAYVEMSEDLAARADVFLLCFQYFSLSAASSCVQRCMHNHKTCSVRDAAAPESAMGE